MVASESKARPRLAICIPAHNAASHLPRLLASVREQTMSFDEVLLFDDASADNTVDVAQRAGARVIATSVNVGPSEGKNRLAAQTSAEWIHFHDADDVLAPRFVEKARRWIEADASDVILFGTHDRDEETNAPLGQRQWDDVALQHDAVSYCILNSITNCGVYRRTPFIQAGGFDSSSTARYNEDQAMHLRLAMRGLRFRADDYLGVIITRRSNSMSSGHPIECARAQLHVMAEAATVTGHRYVSEIGERVWRIAGVLAGYQDWQHARKAVDLALRLGYRTPVRETPAFRALARVSPHGAVYLREVFIRAFKPSLRRNAPVAE